MTDSSDQIIDDVHNVFVFAKFMLAKIGESTRIPSIREFPSKHVLDSLTINPHLMDDKMFISISDALFPLTNC